MPVISLFLSFVCYEVRWFFCLVDQLYNMALCLSLYSLGHLNIYFTFYQKGAICIWCLDFQLIFCFCRSHTVDFFFKFWDDIRHMMACWTLFPCFQRIWGVCPVLMLSSLRQGIHILCAFVKSKYHVDKVKISIHCYYCFSTISSRLCLFVIDFQDILESIWSIFSEWFCSFELFCLSNWNDRDAWK